MSRSFQSTFATALIALVTSAMSLAAAAQSQFFIATDAVANPPTCTDTGASGTFGPGNLTTFLPNTSPNLWVSLIVNGGAPSINFDTEPSQTVPAGSYTLTFASTPFPWTAVVDFAPFVNGQPAGRGIRISVSCPAAGTGTISIVSITFSSAAVPALPAAGLAALSALLALAGLLVTRRRRA